MRWSFRTNGNFIDFVHTDETSLAVESTIFSLHNTSKCVSWSLPEDTTRISFTIDEVKYSNIPITDIDFDGTAMNSQDDFETGIEAMFPGLAGGEGGGGTESVTYAALAALILASGLTVGQQYLITDFATKHYIVDSSGTKPAGNPTITGTTEPLIVTATAVNKVDAVAKSTTFPQDIIHVDFTESNWTDDVSFSASGVIIPGWKGTITFRHDTLLDNYTGYDFRNCKFRRWKTNVAAWSGATTYTAADYVTHSGHIYRSLVGSNLNNTPADGSDFWVQILDLSLTEYWNNNPTSTNGIVSNAALFDDFKTFSESTGGVYEDCCRSNHFGGFKDKEAFFDISATILSNNVFFLHNVGYYTVYTNIIGAEFCFNTFCGDFFINTIGNHFNKNMVGHSFNNNVIGNECIANIFGRGFNSNNIANNFRDSNVIGYNFNSNSVLSRCSGTIFANGAINNTIVFCHNNVIANDFKRNFVQFSDGVNYTASTHVYADYNCHIFIREGGGTRLSYFNSTDTLTIVAANA